MELKLGDVRNQKTMLEVLYYPVPGILLNCTCTYLSPLSLQLTTVVEREKDTQ